jgi:hypothetical protein
MSDAVLGTGSTVELSTDGGSTWTNVDCLTSAEFAETVDMVDTSSNCGAGFKSSVPADAQGVLSVDLIYVNSPGQRLVRTVSRAKTKGKWRFRKEVLAGSEEIIFDGYSSGLTDTAPHAEAVTATFTVTSTDTITYQDQV